MSRERPADAACAVLHGRVASEQLRKKAEQEEKAKACTVVSHHPQPVSDFEGPRVDELEQQQFEHDLRQPQAQDRGADAIELLEQPLALRLALGFVTFGTRRWKARGSQLVAAKHAVEARAEQRHLAGEPSCVRHLTIACTQSGALVASGRKRTDEDSLNSKDAETARKTKKPRTEYDDSKQVRHVFSTRCQSLLFCRTPKPDTSKVRHRA